MCCVFCMLTIVSVVCASSKCRVQCHSHMPEVLILSKCVVSFVERFIPKCYFLSVLPSLFLLCYVLITSSYLVSLYSTLAYSASSRVLCICSLLKYEILYTNSFSLKQCSKLFLIAKMLKQNCI